MRTAYFTFGQTHVHSVRGRTLDKDTVVKITAEDPRQVMADYFGEKWSHECEVTPDCRFFKQIVDITEL